MSAEVFVALASAALLGQAHWFFGNLYEAIVLAPGWKAMAGGQLQLSNGFLAPGSPVRYYLPATPVTVLVTVAAATAGWQTPRVSHLPLALSVACCLISAALTGYLVARVNVRLFLHPGTTTNQKAALATRWVRLNYIRLTTTTVAAATLMWTLTR